jgi:hypothetical protein
MKTEREVRQDYDNWLNELYPLKGINCNPFSILLKEGDPIAYEEGFSDYCDANDIDENELE